MIIAYKVVACSNTEIISEAVTQLLNDGWELWGVLVIRTNGDYCQTLVKYKKTE